MVSGASFTVVPVKWEWTADYLVHDSENDNLSSLVGVMSRKNWQLVRNYEEICFLFFTTEEREESMSFFFSTLTFTPTHNIYHFISVIYIFAIPKHFNSILSVSEVSK